MHVHGMDRLEPPPGAIRLPLLGHRRLTAARAVRLVAILTLLVTIASGVTMRLVDGREFPTIGLGLWWAAQTVTTVGYGDIVPRETAGRIVALLVMFDAVGFMTVATGAVTATLIEGARSRGGTVRSTPEPERFDELGRRLERLEALLRDAVGRVDVPPASADGADSAR
jgi:voltage-gated potassium channel